ncbi:MAG: hypothetical protein PHH30_10510 [Bacteroidales bacterium]|nr:hypothetical protein [Bacteroidales bacterium]
MIVKKLIPPISIENDEVVLNFDASQDCSDWLALGRLRQAAQNGDKLAQAELLRRKNTANCTVQDEPDKVKE